MKQLTNILIPAALLFLQYPVAAQQTSSADPNGQLRGPLAAPVENEPTANSLDRSHQQDWHRVSFQLSGSMCPACLLELQGKLRKSSGVAYAKIDRGPLMNTSGEKHAHPKSVLTTIIYDQHAAAWDTLQGTIKGSYYKCTHIEDAQYN